MTSLEDQKNFMFDSVTLPPGEDHDQQVRYRAFHDAYRNVARMLEEAVKSGHDPKDVISTTIPHLRESADAIKWRALSLAGSAEAALPPGAGQGL